MYFARERPDVIVITKNKCSLLSIEKSRFLVKVKFVCLSTEILLRQTFFRLAVLKTLILISPQAHCSKHFDIF